MPPSLTVDAHLHLDKLLREYRVTTIECLRRAAGASGNPMRIVGLVSNYVFPEGWPNIAQVSNMPRVVFTVGLHPHRCSDEIISSRNLAFIRSQLQEALCRGLGEIGLDYRAHPQPRQRSNQRGSLILLLELLHDRNLPVVIHCRDTSYDRQATQDCMSILSEHLPRNHVVHLHCFCGTPEEVQQWLRLFPNCYFGLSCLLLRTRSNEEREGWQRTVASILLDRVLIETDAPYLPPPEVEAEGRSNHPWTLSSVVEVAASWKKVSCGMMYAASRLNAQRVYGPFPEAN